MRECVRHRKIGYATKLDAMLALCSCKRKLKLKSDFSRTETRIYFDPECSFWHLTSRNKQTQDRKEIYGIEI